MRRLIHPTSRDIPRLKQIWCEGFPDDLQNGYCDFYFDRHFSPERSLAVINGTEIESACHLFDAVCQCADGIDRRFLFFYAAATAEKYRGHSNLQFMVEGCLNYAAQLHYSGMLTAAAEEIIYLYDRWGGKRTSPMHTYTTSYHVPEGALLEMTECSYDAFSVMRKSYLNRFSTAVRWTEASERYMYQDTFQRGKILQTTYQRKTFYAVCTVEEDCIIIRETDMPLALARLLADSVLAHFDYRGELTLYSHDKAELPGFRSDSMYYGHYYLTENFDGSEMLSDLYLNLIAD